MFNLSKNMSMVPKGLRYKTMIAFSLMSLIPILVCGWLVITYIFPNINLFLGLSLSNISFILVISIAISVLGLYITKEMIDPVIKMAEEAKQVAGGDLTKSIGIKRDDEVGELSRSLNIMTQKIKENMEELKSYGEKTKLINMEINKKVIALSGLLQIGNLISSSKELANTLTFITQKVSDIENNSASLVILMDEGSKECSVVTSCNLEENKALSLKLKQDEMISGNLGKKFGLKNTVSVPVATAGKICGALVVGNNEKDFVFADDEKELLKVFAKQISIAVENDILLRRSKELAIKDEVTSLFNYNYMKARLGEEIRRALVYQRPCGYLVLDVDDFKGYCIGHGDVKSAALLKEAGAILQGSVTEIDRVGRLLDDKFGVILPERNKRQSAHIAEEIRKKMEEGLGKSVRSDKRLTVSIGVAENPIDGSTAEEIMEKAERCVHNAKSLGKNRVVV